MVHPKARHIIPQAKAAKGTHVSAQECALLRAFGARTVPRGAPRRGICMPVRRRLTLTSWRTVRTSRHSGVEHIAQNGNWLATFGFRWHLPMWNIFTKPDMEKKDNIQEWCHNLGRKLKQNTNRMPPLDKLPLGGLQSRYRHIDATMH